MFFRIVLLGVYVARLLVFLVRMLAAGRRAPQPQVAPARGTRVIARVLIPLDLLEPPVVLALRAGEVAGVAGAWGWGAWTSIGPALDLVGVVLMLSASIALRPYFDPAAQVVAGQTLACSVARTIAPHPSDANGAWIVVGGFGYPKSYRTADAGTTYTDVTGDFPDEPINALLVDPGDTNVLLAATDVGVLRSTDGGAHWLGFSDGLPLAAVVDVFRHPASGDLVAVTHGRSFYRFRPAATGAVAVPDGKLVPGEEMLAQRTANGALWLRWDTAACTASDYGLFYGPLGDVASGIYADAVCGLGRTGEAVISMPGSAGGSFYFRIAAVSAGGTEGPHGYTSNGTPTPANGVGRCGITAHLDAVTCP